MGGQSKQETTSSSTTQQDPWRRSLPDLNQAFERLTSQWDNSGATLKEKDAISNLEANAANGNPYSANIGLLANDLLSGGKDRTGMVQDAYDQYKGGLLPYTTMSTDPYSNDAFTKYAGQLSTDALNTVKGQYAAAGYDPSAMTFGKSVAEGVGRAVAPVWAQAQSDLENRKLGAINSLYQGGNTTAGLLSGMDQTALGNRVQGVTTANDALTARDSPYTRMLDLEGQARSLPLQNISQMLSLILPMAQLGGTSNTNSQSTTTKTPGVMDTAIGWSGAFKNVFGGGGNGAGAGAGGWF